MTDVVMAMASGGLRNGAETLRLVAENVANTQTVGYRRQIPVMHATFPEMVTNGAGNVAAGAILQTSVLTAVDSRPGPLQRSNDPFHVALSTPGYFVVEANGELALTRATSAAIASWRAAISTRSRSGWASQRRIRRAPIGVRV